MRLVAFLFSLCLCVASASHASADASAIVLGLRSVEGDDDVAHAMTLALRSAARGVPGWSVLDRSVTMTQMSLAHDCDELDAACLNDIARGLGATRVVFGSVRRTSARDDYGYQLALNVFDADKSAIGPTQSTTIPRAQSDDQSLLTQRAQMLLRRLTEGDGGGTLAIQVNVPTAEIRLDGQLVGQTRNRALVLEGVAPGEHTLEILAVGRTTYRETVRVSGTGQTNVHASLSSAHQAQDEHDEADADATRSAFLASEGTDEEPRQRGSLRWLGYTLLGVSAASLVGVGASWLVIDSINGDATYKKYRDATTVDPSVTDVCEEADAGLPYQLSAGELSEVRDMCSRGGTFEVLQWVFLGTALASGGIGAYLLLTETDGDSYDDEDARAKPGKLAWKPKVGRRSFALQATLRF